MFPLPKLDELLPLALFSSDPYVNTATCNYEPENISEPR